MDETQRKDKQLFEDECSPHEGHWDEHSPVAAMTGTRVGGAG